MWWSKIYMKKKPFAFFYESRYIWQIFYAVWMGGKKKSWTSIFRYVKKNYFLRSTFKRCIFFYFFTLTCSYKWTRCTYLPTLDIYHIAGTKHVFYIKTLMLESRLRFQFIVLSYYENQFIMNFSILFDNFTYQSFEKKKFRKGSCVGGTFKYIFCSENFIIWRVYLFSCRAFT